ncbi:hypothetical protein YC2023_053821 [Brassica napus]
MPIVLGNSTRLENNVNAILSSASRENLCLLYPGPGDLLDTTSTTWFKFLSDLSLVIPSILVEGWVHDWPTYRAIPNHIKEHWFLQLAVRTGYVAKARGIEGIIRQFGHILILWPERYFVARCAISRVWRDLVHMFEEFGPDNFGF